MAAALRWVCRPLAVPAASAPPLIRGIAARARRSLLPDGHRVVIDTGPDFRMQALREGINHADAVLYTHSHADHILGLDDLRPLSFKHKGKIPLYADDAAASVIERIFDYTFDPDAFYPTRARVEMHRLGPSVEVEDAVFHRVPLTHGRIEVAGFGSGMLLT